MREKDSSFRIAKKGYDRFQVDQVLANYEARQKELETKLSTYESQVAVASEQLDKLKSRYNDLVSKLSVREKAADEISRLALKEANVVIDTANQNADLIVSEALSTAKILLTELAKVTEDTNHAKDEMKDKIELIQKTLDDIKLPEVPRMDWLKQKEESDT